ncbi:MAG TPA: hydantoinase/oxoprolinase family protein [Deltaproteobacteria bacterium]|nr:hydantoinase/oxoprolinase family protein [Candidatus Binatota bacterium]HIL13247.1 hydantoinase/oxoprolinase family protein [Deltaproteobacteria bacterium]
MSRYVVACDAGGTMTDVIIVDEEGRSVIGKAPTSPQDESIGYMESFWEALEFMGIDREQGAQFGAQVETAIYTGTSMLNTVINMSGYRTGLLVTRGFEDIIAQGRGSQTFINAQWTEITHMQYRKHRTPLVPRSLARGVTERVDMFGQVVIPMYEHEVEQGIRELLVDEQVEAIAIVFLQSFNNATHERRAAEIAREVMKETGREVVLELSSQVAPTTREVSRANATVVQAYASDPARKQLLRIEEEMKGVGYEHSLKTVLGYGGITNIRYPRLFEAAMSGPVGGLMGAKYLSSVIGEDNIVCSDVGGTSFDAGAITAGVLPIDREPGFQDMYVNVPMLGITSIGAGTGTYIRLDPQTNRIKLGPDSAGGTPGPAFLEAGNTTPTINDVNLLLGILNEDNYLGGKLSVNKQVSYDTFKEKVADPLGMDVYVAAETCLELLNVMMREHLVRSLMVGHDLREYVLLGYGGGGPMHLLGYAGDHPWKAVATVPHAGGFSAWGGACMDYSHRRHKSVQALLTPELDDATRLAYVAPVAQAWRDLETELLEELQEEGFDRDQITLNQVAYVRYFGQLEDVEVDSPVATLENLDDLGQLITAFEDLYTKMFTLAAKPDAGSYLITEVCVTAKVATVKPRLRRHELADKKPSKEAFKFTRPVFQGGEWNDADIWRMESLVPGNEIEGLAVIEASNTTLFVPREWKLRIDEHDIYWLTRAD